MPQTLKTPASRLPKEVPIIGYAAVWTIAVCTFWIPADGIDAMGYGIVWLWVMLPAATFIASLLIGCDARFGKGKWLLPLAFGVMYMLVEYATFSTANMISFAKINLPIFSMIIGGAVVSLVGMAIGAVMRKLAARKRTA